MDFGRKFGFHILARLRETGENAERKGRIGEIVGVLDMDIGGPGVEDADGGQHRIDCSALIPRRVSLLAADEKVDAGSRYAACTGIDIWKDGITLR